MNVKRSQHLALLKAISAAAFLHFVCLPSASAADTEQLSEPATEQSGSSDPFILPSLSAVHVRWHDASEIELLRADIELSAQGFRVRQSKLGARHREMLQNFNDNEAWLIDYRRSVAHRLPLEDDFEGVLPKPADAASFLSHEPCGALLTKADAGEGQWRGRVVRAWHCEDEDGNVASIEFVDDEYGIVVYRRAENGQIDELRDLQQRTFRSGHFRPIDKLRLVKREEFFGGAPAIKQYEDTQ